MMVAVVQAQTRVLEYLGEMRLRPDTLMLNNLVTACPVLSM